MADEADIANELIANEISSMLDKLQQRGPVKTGPPDCTACGEAIPAPRRAYGYHLCKTCQEREERRRAQFARQP